MRRLTSLVRRIWIRLLLEFRSRTMGIDTALDRAAFRRALRHQNTRNLVGKLATRAPWSRTPDLDFISPPEIEAVLSKAAEAVRHEFDLLGSGLFNLGEQMNWHLDFKSGFQFPATTHHSKIRWHKLPPGVDIKIPWELSRCMHFITLGLAYRLTGNTEFYQEFKTQIRHWIAVNPPARGVNWVCPMDVALRAINWIQASMLFGDALQDDKDAPFLTEFNEALWMAGSHVAKNLEWNGPESTSTGNHFLANVTGLVTLGLLFDNTTRGKRWLDFGMQWMEREMERQVHPDGSNFESSTSYHRLVMEMFLWAESITQTADRGFSESYKFRLKKMAGFVNAYSGPSGHAPQFGDNDSGRVFNAGIGEPGDHRYLCSGLTGFGGELDRWLLCGNQAPMQEPNDGGFPDGGYWFSRVGEAWIGIRAGQMGPGGGHSHCDQLSLVMTLQGKEILVDRGTGCYSPDPLLRNQLRSTKSHNTLTINGWEQSDFIAGTAGLFRMKNDTSTEVSRWEPSLSQLTFEGIHHGFSRFRAGVICRREVLLKSNSLRLNDQIHGAIQGDHIEWFFHLAPGAVASVTRRSILIHKEGVEILLQLPDGMTAGIEDVPHSPSYGVVVPAPMLRLEIVAPHDGTYCACFEFTFNVA